MAETDTAIEALKTLNKQIAERVWGDHAWIFAVASIIASLVVAICAGLEGLFSSETSGARSAWQLTMSESFNYCNATSSCTIARTRHARPSRCRGGVYGIDETNRRSEP